MGFQGRSFYEFGFRLPLFHSGKWFIKLYEQEQHHHEHQHCIPVSSASPDLLKFFFRGVVLRNSETSQARSLSVAPSALNSWWSVCVTDFNLTLSCNLSSSYFVFALVDFLTVLVCDVQRNSSDSLQIEAHLHHGFTLQDIWY